jgi:hypothetical protein
VPGQPGPRSDRRQTISKEGARHVWRPAVADVRWRSDKAGTLAGIREARPVWLSICLTEVGYVEDEHVKTIRDDDIRGARPPCKAKNREEGNQEMDGGSIKSYRYSS